MYILKKQPSAEVQNIVNNAMFGRSVSQPQYQSQQMQQQMRNNPANNGQYNGPYPHNAQYRANGQYQPDGQPQMRSIRSVPVVPVAYDPDNLPIGGPLPDEQQQQSQQPSMYDHHKQQQEQQSKPIEVQDPFNNRYPQQQVNPYPNRQHLYDVNDNAPAPELPFTTHPEPTLKPMSNKFRQSFVFSMLN